MEMNTNYLCYTQMLDDSDAVIKNVCLQEEVDNSNISLFGWSTGGYLSMICLYAPPNKGFYRTWSTYQF